MRSPSSVLETQLQRQLAGATRIHRFAVRRRLVPLVRGTAEEQQLDSRADNYLAQAVACGCFKAGSLQSQVESVPRNTRFSC